jgi:hypothetical protein
VVAAIVTIVTMVTKVTNAMKFGTVRNVHTLQLEISGNEYVMRIAGAFICNM